MRMSCYEYLSLFLIWPKKKVVMNFYWTIAKKTLLWVLITSLKLNYNYRTLATYHELKTNGIEIWNMVKTQNTHVLLSGQAYRV